MHSNLYKYYILKEKNLVVEVLKGSFNLPEFVYLKKCESEDPSFNSDFNSILDIRNLDNVFTKEIKHDLEEFADLIKEIQHVTKRRKTAVVTSTPAQVTGITWYKLIDERGID